jgi:HKD family nuclease/diadenosine tetraphosphate (Ap4A) HIT family hydrolase
MTIGAGLIEREHLASECPFCAPQPGQVAFRTPDIVGIWDGFPVTEGHLLVVPNRHVARWDDLAVSERSALFEGVERGRSLLKGLFDPAAFNVGYNDGSAAGQTVPHFNIHIIPRRNGDISDPRGGVRHVIPSKGNYLTSIQDVESESPDLLATTPHRLSLISGGEDPLLPHLVRHIDDAISVDIAVAFIMESGARLLIPHLRDLLDRGGKLRFVTGDYLDVSDPTALRHLLDLEGLDGHVERYAFQAGRESFHLKSWVFRRNDGHGLAIVGSSNISETALLRGIEWNYRATSSDTEGWRDVVNGFEQLLKSENIKPLTYDWISDYELRRNRSPAPQAVVVGVTPDPQQAPPTPHAVQTQALEPLSRAREEGYSAGLVVLATGLGKTWLSAFDTADTQFRRVLFVAHRDEILSQAMETFRQCRPQARLGRYDGREKQPDSDVVFASVQTLGRSGHLAKFAADYFDYIVVDEFHHAAAGTYRQLIDHFTPKFMLGLSSGTPSTTVESSHLG